MDAGQVAEFDSPAALLKNTSSIFTRLVAAESSRSISSIPYPTTASSSGDQNFTPSALLVNNVALNNSSSLLSAEATEECVDDVAPSQSTAAYSSMS